MIVHTVAFWNWSAADIEPQVTVSEPIRDVLAEWSQLPPPTRKLLQKSRINIKKNGSLMPFDWVNGCGELTPAMCMFRDIGVRPTSKHKIARHDESKPHGPGNSFWTAQGRPPMQVMVCGKQITLEQAAYLSGMTSDAFVKRMKKLGAESAMLTPSYVRCAYPATKAMEFFNRVDIYADSARMLIRTEQDQWAKDNPGRKQVAESELRAKYHAFIRKPVVRSILKLIELPISDSERSSLLAFMSAPQDVRQATSHVLAGMIRRCTVATDTSFKYYGARGISVCDRWMHGTEHLTGLQCFVIDMGFQPLGMELDRILTDGNYERSNCRWVTRDVNLRNMIRIESIADMLNAAVKAHVRDELKTRGLVASD
jgi:hypothetical protein